MSRKRKTNKTNTTEKGGEEEEGLLNKIVDLESQIGSNIAESVNIPDIYQLPADSLISILDTTEPLDISIARTLNKKIKENYSETDSTEICSHIKIVDSNAKSLCTKLSSIVSNINNKSTNQKKDKTNQQPIKLLVKTLTGKRVKVWIKPEDTIADLKQCIEDMEGIPVDQQRLIFAGKQLEDENTLEQYSILAGSTILMSLRLRG